LANRSIRKALPEIKIYTHFNGFGVWCLTPLSTILQLYRGGDTF